MRKGLFKEDSGVAPLVEYIITFAIASIIFTMVLLMSNSMFIDGPQKTVSKVQFTDIGNDLTAKVMDTYLLAPDSSSSHGSLDFDLSTTFDMPTTVANKMYDAEVRNSTNNKAIVVYYPGDASTEISVTLNGVNSTIPVNGSTSSTASTHRIYYHI